MATLSHSVRIPINDISCCNRIQVPYITIHIIVQTHSGSWISAETSARKLWDSARPLQDIIALPGKTLDQVRASHDTASTGVRGSVGPGGLGVAAAGGGGGGDGGGGGGGERLNQRSGGEGGVNGGTQQLPGAGSSAALASPPAVTYPVGARPASHPSSLLLPLLLPSLISTPPSPPLSPLFHEG